MQKRVLPPRINRGRRPQPSQQQEARDEIIYNHIFQKAMKQVPISPAQKIKTQSKLDSAQNQFQHRQFYSNNRVCYPYSRGYHYFFDLSSFPREDHSVSYAVDEYNLFNTTYSQENKIVKDDLTVGKLFNRKLFGLPVCLPAHLGIKTNDKNICHSYLFVNEDRKFNTDRSIYELRQIHDNFNELYRKGQIHKFSCLKKDVDLLSILEDQLSIQEKKGILAKRIKILEEKKQSMKNFVILQDKHFFYHSLNQRLHNKVQQKMQQLSDSYILGHLYVYDNIRAKLSQCQENERKSQLKKLLSYSQFQKQCVSEGMMEQINKRLERRFYQKEQNSELYIISAPFIIYNFSNLNIMTVCEKILALKCAHQSEALFYMCKLFWKRTFDRDLVLNKQFKPLTRPEYDKAMNLIIIQLQRWKKQQQKKGQLKSIQETKCPIIDPIIDLSVFQPQSKSFDLVRIQNQVEISIRQYISIQLFYQLYLSMTQIYEFILTNGVLTELIVGDFFNRGNNFITEVMGSVRVGLIQQILRKLTENIIKQDITSQDFKLKLVYNEQLGVAYIIKSSPESDWETEKQQQNGIDQQKIQSNEHNKDESQEIIDKGPQKRVFK